MLNRRNVQGTDNIKYITDDHAALPNVVYRRIVGIQPDNSDLQAKASLASRSTFLLGFVGLVMASSEDSAALHTGRQ